MLTGASDHVASQPCMQLCSRHALPFDADPAAVFLVDLAHKSTAPALDRPEHVMHAMPGNFPLVD